MIRRRHGKTPYELLHNKPPDLSYLHVFGALCYPTNNSENLGKLQPKADIGIFIGYAPTKKAFRIYNRHTKRIIETINVDFDELTAMASEHSSSGPALHEMTSATIDSRLFCVDSTGSPSSTTFEPRMHNPPSNSQTTPETEPPVIPNNVEEDNHDIEVAHMGNDLYFGVPIQEIPSDQSSSSDSIHTIQALFYYYDAFFTAVEPKTYKDALTQACWIEATQEELNEFEQLEVWELVPQPDKVMVITLKWIYKVKLDELGEILKNKARYSMWCIDKKGIDFEEVVYQMDVNTVFLNGILREEFKLGQRMASWIKDNPITYIAKESSLWVKTTLRAAFADADHAGCQDTRRSTSGSRQLWVINFIWSSKGRKALRYQSGAEYMLCPDC
ncbi:retrovirus-related pol polyprotein from transposon TNT 1-94 [Tanacetum coccineum]